MQVDTKMTMVMMTECENDMKQHRGETSVAHMCSWTPHAKWKRSAQHGQLLICQRMEEGMMRQRRRSLMLGPIHHVLHHPKMHEVYDVMMYVLHDVMRVLENEVHIHSTVSESNPPKRLPTPPPVASHTVVLEEVQQRRWPDEGIEAAQHERMRVL